MAGVDQHALAVANLSDEVIDLKRVRAGVAQRGEIGVREVRGESAVQGEIDAGDDVAVPVGGVEDAAAIAEGALVRRQVHEAESLKIECMNVADGRRDLLAVGADVLDGGAAGEAGDAGETLDAGEALLAGEADERDPSRDRRRPAWWSRPCDSAGTSSVLRARWRTRPGKPRSSGTRRLDPPPSANTGR